MLDKLRNRYMRKLMVTTILLGMLLASFAVALPQVSAETASITGTLTFEPGDTSHPYDDYTILAEGGQVLDITLRCLTPMDPYVRVFDEFGTALESDDDSPLDDCGNGNFYSSALSFVVPY